MWLPTYRSKSKRDKEEIDFLRAQVAQLQNYVLMTGGGAPTGFPTWTPPTEEAGAEGFPEPARRLYTTEDEEDIMFREEEGIIGEAEAKRLLAQVRALNSDDIDSN